MQNKLEPNSPSTIYFSSLPIQRALRHNWCRRTHQIGTKKCVACSCSPFRNWLTFLFPFSFPAGISTWGKRVGRKLDQIKPTGESSSSSDRLNQYVVNPVVSGGGGTGSEGDLLLMAKHSTRPMSPASEAGEREEKLQHALESLLMFFFT